MTGGLTAAHVVVLAGLLATDFNEASVAIHNEAVRGDERYVLRLVPRIFEHDFESYNPRGMAACFGRGRLVNDRYRAACIANPKLELGRPFHDHGLRRLDTLALDGLWTLGRHRMIELLGGVGSARGGDPFGGRIMRAIDRHRDVLEGRGKSSHYNRGKAAYLDRCARFEQRQQTDRDERWRDAPVTRTQHFTMIDTATELGIEPSVARTRGEAFDWLRDHNAILKYRSYKENGK